MLVANREYWRGRPRLDEYIDTIEPRSEMLNKYFQDGMLDILYTYSISKMVSYKEPGLGAGHRHPLPVGHLSSWSTPPGRC